MKKSFKQNIFAVILALVTIAGCGDDGITVIPPSTGSDLTRSGKFISFTSNQAGNNDIYIAQVTPAGVLETANLVYPVNPFPLTIGNPGDDRQSNWSPNGRMLVYSRTNGGAKEIYAFFFNADGSLDSNAGQNPRRLFSSSGNWDENPSFSPSGTYLIWDRREDNNGGGIDTTDSRDLYIADVSDSGANLQVSNPRAISTTSGPDEYNPKWSPRISVRRIAYEYQSSATSTDHDVYVIDPLDPANNQNFYNPNNSGYPAWAPDCGRIIFESDKTSGNYWMIVSLPYPAGGNPAAVVDEAGINSRYPTWLPNGGLLAYIRYTGGNGNIYIVSTSGGTPSKLLQGLPQFDDKNNLWPAW